MDYLLFSNIISYKYLIYMTQYLIDSKIFFKIILYYIFLITFCFGTKKINDIQLTRLTISAF